MAPWVSGRPWKRCIRKRSSSAAGCTRPRTCSMRCRKPVNPMPNRRCMTSGRPRQRRMPNRRLICFRIRMRRNIQRQRLVCRRIVRNCWPSTAFRQNTGKACVRAIPSNRPLALPTASHQAIKGLLVTGRHATHDVQARHVRRAELEKVTRL